ncbi:hypothetical protein IPG36_06610 [bacterium]|nr:MAG: hypothetical protein IPG36_06610 [bacterium]
MIMLTNLAGEQDIGNRPDQRRRQIYRQSEYEPKQVADMVKKGGIAGYTHPGEVPSRLMPKVLLIEDTPEMQRMYGYGLAKRDLKSKLWAAPVKPGHVQSK